MTSRHGTPPAPRSPLAADPPFLEHVPMLNETKISIKPAQQIVFSAKSSTLSATQRAQKFLRKRFCILNWIGKYNLEWGINDLIAGITLGLTIIPESIACALLAGLPARYGLCSAFIGCFIYLFTGSIDKVIIGPTSLVALVALQFTVGKPIEFAVMLTFMTGVVHLIMATMQLGFIFEFISMPVIKAFSSATCILVIESQLKVVFGIKYLAKGFTHSIKTLTSRLSETSTGDLVMGISALTFLILFEQLEKLATRPKATKMSSIICRYMSFSRNTLIVFITAIVSYVWLTMEPEVPYVLSKNALSGLPNFTLPLFTIETPEKVYSFWDILCELNIGIIVVPIIGLLTNISIGKLTPKGLVDTNQELMTLGVCNIFGACVQSMPTSGAFSRYAISTACGLKTPMANLYSGIVVLLALSFLSPCFNYIPEATLAAILMCSIFTLLDLHLPLRLWYESKRDFAIWLLCFIVCIFWGVEVGLVVSIFVNVLHLLYLWARPEITVKIKEIDEMQYICVTPGNGIYFPAINHLRAKVLKAAAQANFKVPIVIDCHKITGLDFTAAQGITKLAAGLKNDEENDDMTAGTGDNLENGNGGSGDGDGSGTEALLILYRMELDFQRMIDNADNLVYCEQEDKLREFLTQEALRNGFINLKEHIRKSIDLGYQMDGDNQ